MANHLETTEHWLQHLDLRDTHIPRITRSWSTRDKIIAEMGKRGNALALEIKRKLELLQELSESDRVYIKRKVRGPFTPYVLSEKKRGFLSSSKIAKLNSTSLQNQLSLILLTAFARIQGHCPTDAV